MLPKILFACGAYGRVAKLEDWSEGKDFKLLRGPYFSVRDVEKMKAEGVERIEFESQGKLVMIVDLLNNSTVVK